MDEEHCLLPWQPDLITGVIRAGVSAGKTYTADTHLHDEKQAIRRSRGALQPRLAVEGGFQAHLSVELLKY